MSMIHDTYELPNGESVEWSVDAHGRASSVTWSSGTTLVSYAGTARVPQRIADPDGVVLTFSHDGPLMEAMTWAGPVNGHVEFGFDASWRTERVGVTGGEATTYTRDADGLITRAASSGGSELEVVRDDETGRVEALDIGVVHDAYVYDGTASTPGFGDLTSRSIQVGDDELLVLAYQYDDAGRIERLTEEIDGEVRIRRLEYDQQGQLHRVLNEEDAVLEEYAYDANGNRVLAMTATRVARLGIDLGCPSAGGSAMERAADSRDRLCRYGEYLYSYDENGRLAARSHFLAPGVRTSYEYDSIGRLRGVATSDGELIEYIHDGLGRRVGRVVNGVFERGWLYKDSLNPIAQVNAAGVVEATYVYVTRANVPDYIVTTAGAVYRVVADHLGSVRMLVNATTGAVVERYDYDVWGRVTFESGDHSLHPFGYAGGLYDADTGLVRFGVRDYDADAGRWTAPEPLGFAAEANWYRYAAGDPVNFVDPNGLRHYPARDVMRLMQSIYHAYRNALPGTDFFILYGLHCGASVLDFYGNGATDTFEVPGRGTMTARDFGNYIAGYSGYYAGGDFGAYLSSMGGHFYAIADDVVDAIAGGRDWDNIHLRDDASDVELIVHGRNDAELLEPLWSTAPAF